MRERRSGGLRPAFTVVAALLLWTTACDSPTEPGRPRRYEAVFIGSPGGALFFTPLDVDSGRIVGFAETPAGPRAYQWASGVFSPVGPAPAPGCSTIAYAVRLGRTAGQTICPAPGTPAVDVSGWVVPGPPSGRIDAAPHGFRALASGGPLAGTRYPGPEWPVTQRRAFIYQAGITELVPPEAQGSEAVGISDENEVAVTAFSICPTPGCVTSQAAAWSEGHWRMIPLPQGATEAQAVAMSSDGDVAGNATGAFDQPFRWSRGDGLRPLVVIPGATAHAADVNRLEQVVGSLRRGGPLSTEVEGVIWFEDRIYPLSERVRGEGWRIREAVLVDDQRNIVAFGRNDTTGQDGLLILVPSR